MIWIINPFFFYFIPILNYEVKWVVVNMSDTEDKKTRSSWLNRDNLIYIILICISVTAPLISYAGISLIYPVSTMTADVNLSPPITWAAGEDYTRAAALGFASSFNQGNNAGSFSLTLSGLSGGTITIDKLLVLNADEDINTYKIQIETALSGTLTPAATILKLRFWNTTAPVDDGSAIAVLDLKSGEETETAAIGGNQSVNIQLIYQLASNTSGSSTVIIQPSSIVVKP
jgi:hypothetical protein